MRPEQQVDDAAAVDRLLDRLDASTATLSSRDDVLAVLGLGSTGKDHQRLDAHSDLDVFIVVEDHAVDRYRSHSSWWGEVAPVAYAFAHTHDGWKVLYEDLSLIHI